MTSTTIVAALGDSDLTGVPGASVAERAAFLAGWSDRRLAEGLAAARGAPRSERLRLAVQHIGRHGTVDLVLVTTRQPTPERNDTWMIAELLRRAVPAADEHKWLGRIGSIATIELTQALELAAVLAELEAPLARALTPGARHVLAHGGGTPSISLATLILTVGLASTAARPCEIVSLIEEATGSSRAVTQHVSAAIGSGRALLAPGLRTAIDRARRRRDPAAACALARTLEMAIGDPAGDSIRYEAAAILERRGISDGRLAGRLAGVAQSGSAVRWTADALAAGRRREVGVVLLGASALGALSVDDHRRFADVGYRLLGEAGDLLARRHGIDPGGGVTPDGRYRLEGRERGRLIIALRERDPAAALALAALDSVGLDAVRNAAHHAEADSPRERVEDPPGFGSWRAAIETILAALDLELVDPVAQLLAARGETGHVAPTVAGRRIAIMLLGARAVSEPPPAAARTEVEAIARADLPDRELCERLALTCVRDALARIDEVDELWLVGTDQPGDAWGRSRDTGPLARLVARRWDAWAACGWQRRPATVRAVVPRATPMTSMGPALSALARDAVDSAGAAGTVVLIDAIGPKELRIPLVLDVLAASDDRGCAVHVVGNLLAANPPLDLGRAIAERRAAVARRLAVGALAQRHDAVGLLDLQGLEGACLRDLAARLRAGLVPRAQTIRAAWRELNAAAAPEDERLLRLFDGLLASSRSAAGRTQLAAELALHEAWRTRTTDLPTAYAAVNRAVECLIELDVPVAITLSGRWRELRNEHAHAAMTVAPTTAAIEELAGEIRAALGIDDPAMPWIEALELLGIGVAQREDPALAFVALLAERALRAGPVTADRARSQPR